MTEMVLADDFLTDNYLSTERRIPVTLLQTNACSPLATNALGGNIWDNFSSQTYKDLPSVGKMTVHNPIDGSPWQYDMPAGGRGYTRVPSLISLWSTAPFLLNNSVGKFNPSPSVEGRMDSFNDSIEKMLWPEKRDKDPILGDKVPGFIYRTTETSYIKIAPGFVSPLLEKMLSWGGWLNRWFPWLFSEEGIEIGPIPKGTPVSLLTNIDLDSSKLDIAKLLLKIKADLKAVEGKSEQEAAEVFKGLVPDLLKVSKCPDFVVNKGHYFGTGYVERRAGVERRRQARADRVLENLLTALSRTSVPMSEAAAPQPQYEYIVVGSGAGGGTVAARLAEAGRSVLLLEAGGDPCELADSRLPEDYQVPAFHAFASENPAMRWDFFVRHYADEQRQQKDRKYSPDRGGVLYPRAGTLGGCTAHNAMIFVYPQNQDWDDIASLTGDSSWRAGNMRRYFEVLEDCRHRPLKRWIARWTGFNPSRHGFSGWLTTEVPMPMESLGNRRLRQVLEELAMDASLQIGDRLKRLRSFFKTRGDPNDWRQVYGPSRQGCVLCR